MTDTDPLLARSAHRAGASAGLRVGGSATRAPSLVMPHDEHLEAAVIGAMMLDADAAQTGTSLLQGAALYSERNRIVYAAVRSLVLGGSVPDIVSVTAELRRTGTLAAAGGPAAVTDMTSTVGSAANVGRHCLVLTQTWMLRRYIEQTTLSLQQATEQGADALEIIAAASRDLALLDESAQMQTGGPKPLASTVDPYLDSLLAGRPLAIPTGLRALASLIEGHKRGRLYIYAGRPGMGKSGLGLGFARMGARQGLLSSYFSLEMPSEEVHDRLLALDSGVSGRDVPHLPHLREDQQRAIYASAERLKALPLHIDDTPALSIDDLRTRLWRLSARAAREGREMGPVVVDYVQLMKGRRERGQARHEEIASVTRALKSLAKELNAPVIALSQVPRAVEQRADRRPTMSDLAESSSLESDADVVTFVYRDEVYGETRDAEGRETKGIAELIVAKQRGGALGSRRVAFIGERTMFADLADPYDDRAADPF